MQQKKIKVLVFTSYFLPSYLAGGPIRTICNMVALLGEKIEFWVVTRDRDLGDINPFEDVETEKWLDVDGTNVMYLTDGGFRLEKLKKLVNDSNWDIVYLNSFFDVFLTTRFLWYRKRKVLDEIPVILAPRGEFSSGALALKSFKKNLFIKLSSWLGLYKNIVWQASSELEKQDILNALSADSDSIFIAKDLPSKNTELLMPLSFTPSEEIKLVFLSRISPMKNLDFALRVLASVKSPLSFDIYGPIEDEGYWLDCLKLIEELPKYVVVKYCGAVRPEQVSDIFARYDLFLFPTRGENYGHVIAESLSVGTPLLISDQTPWQDLENDKLGWDLPLDLALFARKIEEVANMDAQTRLSWRQQVAATSVQKINCEQDIADNIALFQFAMDRFQKG